MKKKIRNIFLRITFLVIILQFLSSFLYVNFFGLSLYTKEQYFEKEGHKVILLGTAHVGEYNYYKSLKKDRESLFFLKEGVQGIPKESLGNNHQLWADRLGLIAQNDKTFEGFRGINSDINISEIDPESSRNLELLIFASESSDNFEIAKEEWKETNFSLKEFYQEFVLKRNKIIKKNIIKNQDKDLIIPWGALHHNDLEDFLISEGYSKTGTKYHKVFSFPTLLLRKILSFF